MIDDDGGDTARRERWTRYDNAGQADLFMFLARGIGRNRNGKDILEDEKKRDGNAGQTMGGWARLWARP